MELKLKKETAKKLYPVVPEWFQETLAETFGKDCFKKRKYDEIKTFEDACEELELTQEDLLHIGKDDTPDEAAYKKLKIVIAAINQGWTPDWNNSNQKKWWPYFNLSSGFGFSSAYYSYDNANSTVGSRLCFESDEKAAYAGKQFLNLYKEFLT